VLRMLRMLRMLRLQTCTLKLCACCAAEPEPLPHKALNRLRRGGEPVAGVGQLPATLGEEGESCSHSCCLRGSLCFLPRALEHFMQ